MAGVFEAVSACGVSPRPCEVIAYLCRVCRERRGLDRRKNLDAWVVDSRKGWIIVFLISWLCYYLVRECSLNIAITAAESDVATAGRRRLRTKVSMCGCGILCMSHQADLP